MASSYVRSGHKLNDLRLNVAAAQGRVWLFFFFKFPMQSVSN